MPLTGEEARIQEAYARRAPVRAARYAGVTPGRLFQMQERERVVVRALGKHGALPLAGRRILEIGCGTGAWLRDFVRWGGHPGDIAGLELLPGPLREAQALCPTGVALQRGSAAALPFAGASFDIVLQATVFTSVLDAPMKRAMAAEMLRVLRPDGLVLWYDFRLDNPWNADVRGIGPREIRALFPGCRIALRRLGLAPPVARWLAPRSWLLCRLLAAIPPARAHLLAVIRRAPRAG
jgi:SAM-dependent methyltransferase